MSLGALAVVEEWLDAVNRGDGPRVEQLSIDDVEVVGPRGIVRGRGVLSEWMARAGFSAEARRWFCGANATVIVEQDPRAIHSDQPTLTTAHRVRRWQPPVPAGASIRWERVAFSRRNRLSSADSSVLIPGRWLWSVR